MMQSSKRIMQDYFDDQKPILIYWVIGLFIFVIIQVTFDPRSLIHMMSKNLFFIAITLFIILLLYMAIKLPFHINKTRLHQKQFEEMRAILALKGEFEKRHSNLLKTVVDYRRLLNEYITAVNQLKNMYSDRVFDGFWEHYLHTFNLKNYYDKFEIEVSRRLDQEKSQKVQSGGQEKNKMPSIQLGIEKALMADTVFKSIYNKLSKDFEYMTLKQHYISQVQQAQMQKGMTNIAKSIQTFSKRTQNAIMELESTVADGLFNIQLNQTSTEYQLSADIQELKDHLK